MRSPILSAYERDMIRRGLAEGTRVRSLATVRKLLAHAGKRIERIRLDDLRAYLASRREELSALSQANEVYRLRAFFRWTVEGGRATEDPTLRLLPPRGSTPPQILLSEHDVTRLLEESSKPRANTDHARAVALRDRALLEVLYGLGLRGIEARRSLVADFDRATGSLLVRRAKGGQPEPLPLPRAAVPHVVHYLDLGRPLLARHGNDGRLFLTDRGLAVRYGSWVWKRVEGIGKRAGVKVHPHALRRAVATHSLRQGVSAPAIQALLGHASLEVTQEYLEPDLQALRRAVCLE